MMNLGNQQQQMFNATAKQHINHLLLRDEELFWHETA